MANDETEKRIKAAIEKYSRDFDESKVKRDHGKFAEKNSDAETMAHAATVSAHGASCKAWRSAVEAGTTNPDDDETHWEHSPKTESSRDAMQASKNGQHGFAGHFHLKAAEGHEAVIKRGDDGHLRHKTAAKFHRQAADLHSKISSDSVKKTKREAEANNLSMEANRSSDRLADHPKRSEALKHSSEAVEHAKAGRHKEAATSHFWASQAIGEMRDDNSSKPFAAISAHVRATAAHDRLAARKDADDASDAANSDDGKTSHKHASVMHQQAAAMYDPESEPEDHRYHTHKAEEHLKKAK